jgi:hypothetical protein
VRVGDEVRELCPGEAETFELHAPAAAAERESRARSV